MVSQDSCQDVQYCIMRGCSHIIKLSPYNLYSVSLDPAHSGPNPIHTLPVIDGTCGLNIPVASEYCFLPFLVDSALSQLSFAVKNPCY